MVAGRGCGPPLGGLVTPGGRGSWPAGAEAVLAVRVLWCRSGQLSFFCTRRSFSALPSGGIWGDECDCNKSPLRCVSVSRRLLISSNILSCWGTASLSRHASVHAALMELTLWHLFLFDVTRGFGALQNCMVSLRCRLFLV